MSCSSESDLAIALATTPNPPWLKIRKAYMVWRRDFGFVEVITFAGQVILAIACWLFETSNWVAAASGESGEYILFFSALILHDCLKSGGSLREVYLKVFSLAPVEFVDFGTRPLILSGVTVLVSMISILENFGGPIIIIVGKVLADIVFYTLYYRFRQRVELIFFSLRKHVAAFKCRLALSPSI